MRHKNKLILFFIFLMTAAFALYLDHIVVHAISQIHNLGISYKSFKNISFKEFVLSDLEVIDKRRGMGLFSKHATLKPKWALRSPKDLTVDFHLNDVRFIKNKSEGLDSYDTLSGLVYVPFTSRWTYKEISGTVATFKKGIHIEDLAATSDDIKLSLVGNVYYDNKLDTDIVIYFSKRLVDKIPEVLSEVVLQDVGDGWKTLSVSLKGDYKTPSIQLSSKLFRLNIGGLSETRVK